ncbi:NgoFVII family restriction endonuclease [bacterium]|nr:NgoFVII family restriction endonuclease [bacterium]
MPTIYDNIREKLADELKTVVAQSYRTDFCVGYFNLRGWGTVADLIDKFGGTDENCCRLIVGMQRPSEDVLKEVLSNQKEGKVDQARVAFLKKEMAREFRDQLTYGIPTSKDENALRQLSEQLKAKKVIVKLYLAHTLHAKLYLAYRDDNKAPTIGYLGSSNLTMSGLEKQGELNVDVFEKDAADKLAQWFQDRWDDRFAIDITDELAEIIDESWAGEKVIPPYYIYLKIAWHLSQEAQTGEKNFEIPEEFNDLFSFQKKAVALAAQHLYNRNGVMIGDVVGLGKTMTASALAKLYEETFIIETLIICPKNLVEMWEDYRHKYRLRARVFSISKVNKTWLEKERRYRLVIIDESHNLRNRDGKRYGLIKDYLEQNESRVILLTATPYNKSYLDISSQLRLFMSEDQDLGFGPERFLEEIGGQTEYVAEYQSSPFSLVAFEKSEHADDWRELLKMFLVRRTRTFIKENYAEFDESKDQYYLTYDGDKRYYFPKRIPRKIEYDFDPNDPDDVYAKLFSADIVSSLNALQLPRYGLGNYIENNKRGTASNQEEEILSNLTMAGRRLMGFCRTNLFKRLESSGYSFLLSLSRHVMRNYIFIYAIENKLDLPIGVQELEMDEYLEEHDEDLAELGVLSLETDESHFQKSAKNLYNVLRDQAKKHKWISPEFFRRGLKKHLKEDAARLIEIIEMAKNWDASTDKQIDALERLCQNDFKNEKVLVFTQFADTANYLYNELKRRGVTHIAQVTGANENPTVFAHRFSPNSNKYKFKKNENELRIIITTDVLSEGQNLQDAHVIVNFDLPWALIRLIQRAGRVDRIGQKAPEIFCYSFLPADGLETIIQLRGRLQQRITENAEVVGSDEMFFDGDPVNITDLYNEKAGILDEDETDDEVDLTSKAYEIWNQATKANPKLAKEIKALPNVVYSTKPKPDAAINNGVISYHKTAFGIDVLTWLDENGNVRSKSQNRILNMLECSLETPALKRLENHHELVGKAVKLAQKTHKNMGGHLGKKSSARYKIYHRLKRLEQENENTLFESEDLRKAIDDIYKFPLQESTKTRLNRRMRMGLTDDELSQLVIGLRNEGRLCVISKKESETNLAPQVICSMGLKEVN